MDFYPCAVFSKGPSIRRRSTKRGYLVREGSNADACTREISPVDAGIPILQCASFLPSWLVFDTWSFLSPHGSWRCSTTSPGANASANLAFATNSHFQDKNSQRNGGNAPSFAIPGSKSCNAPGHSMIGCPLLRRVSCGSRMGSNCTRNSNSKTATTWNFRDVRAACSWLDGAPSLARTSKA